MKGTSCVDVVAVADVVTVKVRSDEDASVFPDVVASLTDDSSKLIVVAKESDGMFSGASEMTAVSTVYGVAAVVFVDEVGVCVADLVDPMSRVVVVDVFAVSNATADVIAVMTETVDAVFPSVFVVVTVLFGVTAVGVVRVDVALFMTDALAVSIFVS